MGSAAAWRPPCPVTPSLLLFVGFLLSFLLSLLLYVIMGFYLISFHSHYFVRHLGRETEKAWGQSSIFFPAAGYDHSRRTATGLSCFPPALNTRNLTSDFRKGAWKLFWKLFPFYTSVERIESPTGLSAPASRCQMSVTSDRVRFSSI